MTPLTPEKLSEFEYHVKQLEEMAAECSLIPASAAGTAAKDIAALIARVRELEAALDRAISYSGLCISDDRLTVTDDDNGLVLECPELFAYLKARKP